MLSDVPKPGRNETVWVHLRNCLHEEVEGIETVASLSPELTEAAREGRTRHVADIIDEGGPEDEEETVLEGDAMDIRLGRRESEPEPELNANPETISRSTRSETHAESETEVSTSIGTGMKNSRQ